MLPILIPDALPAAAQDEQAVAAVRRGEPERYRELVERHQRRVYAVAWSRLGDATLAEEATQEAFIRAYRSLPLLGDGAKFSAWIGAIARNLAISLGLRHRRELNKRARWALEQPVAEAPPSAEEEMCTPEMLRQTLSELPPAHRECLVLFYLEGKSGAEAAAILDISETALRMRLVRARVALREKLEARLGESLGQLRPTSSLVPSVMGVVLSSSSAKIGGGAGLGATVLAAMGKVLPFKFLMLFAPAVGLVPSLGLTWWLGRAERRNYRDTDGFRARLHREFTRNMLWFIGAIMLSSYLVAQMGSRLLGFAGLFLVLGLFSLGMTGFIARRLVINRSRFQFGMSLNSLIMTAGILAVALGLLPVTMLNVVIVLSAVAMIPFYSSRPLRMDYNLFLRAAQGLLKNPAENGPVAEVSPRRDSPQLLAFARFLGERWLVGNHRWLEEGLMLRLPAVKTTQATRTADMFSLSWKNCSQIVLGWDGTVSTHCGTKDEKFLLDMVRPSPSQVAAWEAQVASAIGCAWRSFQADDFVSAESVLGQVPDAEVFKAPPARAPTTRWFAAIMVVLLVALVWLEVKQWRMGQESEINLRLHTQVSQLMKQDTIGLKQVIPLRQQLRRLNPEFQSRARDLIEQMSNAEARVHHQIQIYEKLDNGLYHSGTPERDRAIEQIEKMIRETSPMIKEVQQLQEQARAFIQQAQAEKAG